MNNRSGRAAIDEINRPQGSILSDETVARIAEQMAKRLSDVETMLLKTIGKRIKAIGKMLPSDASRLAMLREVGADVSKINAYLRWQTELNQAELDAIYEAAARENQEFARKFYGANSKDFIPFDENAALQAIVEAEKSITAEVFSNIARSSVIAGAADRHGEFVPIAEGYRALIDKAITAARNGVGTYNEQIHDALKRLARNGIQVIEYESGQKRRADTAVRMNVLDGVRAVNQKVAEQVGNEFGADGVELTAHATCAPDHLPMQGRQFSKEEFEKLQNAEASKDYQGHTYAPIKRSIGIWNCRHFAYPIILGVSKPIHSDEELDKLREENEKKIEIDGKEYTPYEASQYMRRIETEIRKAKNEITVFEASGDMKAANNARARVTALETTYEHVAKTANQRMKHARIRVPGVAKVITERARLRREYDNNVQTKALDAPGFVGKFEAITENKAVNQTIYESAVNMLTHRNGTNREDLYLIDGENGNVIHAITTSNQHNSISYDEAALEAIEKAHRANRTIIALHNHPNGLPPTMDDGVSAFIRGYDLGVVVGHNLEVYTYSPTNKFYAESICSKMHAYISNVISFSLDFDESLWYNVFEEFGMKVRRV